MEASVRRSYPNVPAALTNIPNSFPTFLTTMHLTRGEISCIPALLPPGSDVLNRFNVRESFQELHEMQVWREEPRRITS